MRVERIEETVRELVDVLYFQLERNEITEEEAGQEISGLALRILFETA